MEKGAKFGRLTYDKPVSDGGAYGRAQFICDCGRTAVVYKSNVKKGKTRSCGCLRKEAYKNPTYAKHGEAKTPTYQSWMNMMYRCYNEKATGYGNYGGRGITVAPEWHDYLKFKTDMGSRPQKTTLDRIDTNEGYNVTNCRWASRRTQGLNRRKREGTTSKYKGVSLHRRDNKWTARIRSGSGTYENLGYFDTEEQAFEAFNSRYIELNGVPVPYPTVDP